MKRIRNWIQRVYDDRITREYDNMVLVVGDEGVGKSTLILHCIAEYQRVRGVDFDADSVIERTAWDQDDFKTMLANDDARTAIAVHDAARVLHKREAMHPGQIEVEKDLLDARIREHFILLGFQDWDTVPTMLQQRRCQHCLYVPTRGTVWGYGRDTLDGRVGETSWPSPDLTDQFPDLSGSDVYEQFKDEDIARKQERITPDDDEPDSEDAARQEKIRTVLNAVEPWDDDRGMTYEDAGDLVGYSYEWVRQRVREWNKGEHEDLVETQMPEPA